MRRSIPHTSLCLELPRGIAGNTQDCELMIDQSRTIDNRRFSKALGHLPAPLLREVTRKLAQLAEIGPARGAGQRHRRPTVVVAGRQPP